MKKQQTTHGALRARTRAFLCAIALLSFTTARADYTVTTQVLPAEAAAAGCTVSGAGTYADGTKIQFTATPASGWVFVQWRDKNNDARNPTPQKTYTNGYTAIAFFVPEGTPTHKIYTALDGDAAAEAVITDSPVSFNVGGGTRIENLYEGTIVHLQTSNWTTMRGRFVQYNDGYTECNVTDYGESGIQYQCDRDITVGNADATYTATWTYAAPAPVTPTYTVAATISPEGAGTVTGADTYEEGNNVTLTATPANRRYVFSHWTDGGDNAGTTGNNVYAINSIAADHNNVVAVFTEVPVTIADNEESSYYSTTLSTFTGSMDFQLMRTFYAGMWNTVCFPFDLTASQITASDMRTATFYTLSSVTGDAAEGLDFNVSEVTSISARTPYLVQVSGANIVNPVFEGVTLAASAFTNNTTGTNVGDTRFFGTVHPTSLETGENSGFLFLGQNNQLYWPNVANDIRAFRAYFYSGNNTVQAVHPRVRLVVRPETPTDVIEGYNADTWSAVVPARKVLDNGNLIIERDGIRYNAVGQKVN